MASKKRRKRSSRSSRRGFQRRSGSYPSHAKTPARFVMQIARSRRGDRGWELAELVSGAGPSFRYWSQSSIAVRREAHRLGATDDNLYIEGVPAREYIMPEGTGAATRARHAESRADLTAEQKRVLLHKHLTGDFPGQKWATVLQLIKKGMLVEQNKQLLLTPKGRAYCDEHHMEM